MVPPLIRRIARWRFERPLAGAFGLAILFAVTAVPPAEFEGVPLVGGAAGVGGQFGIGLALGLLLGGAAWVAMQLAATPIVRAEPVDPLDEAPEIAVPAERLVRLRRADAHPDAPPREPIRAARDLGAPFMSVGSEPEERAAVADAEFEEVAEAEPAAAPEATSDQPVLTAPESKTPADAAEPVPAQAEAFAVEPVAPPAPVRLTPPIAKDASLGDLVERLAAGVERRGGQPPRRPASHPQLRAALEELNRLAGRRA